MKNKIIFPAAYYLDPQLKDQDLRKIKKSIVSHPKTAKYYLILISAALHEQLDIVSCKELCSPLYREESYTVYGIAHSKEAAMELIVSMTDDCLQKLGRVDLKEYLSCGPLC